MRTLTATLQSLSLSSPFLHGTAAPKSQFSHLTIPSLSLSTSLPSLSRTPCFLPQIRAMKSMQGRVVCATSDKTVAVEVTRLAPHPKYKRRVRKKKKYQAHDPLNQFNVGDWVQLEKSRPFSKTKAFLAIQVPIKTAKQKKQKEGESGEKTEIGLPLESQLGTA